MRLRFSKAAEEDLIEVASYTMENWDYAQAVRYLKQLDETCWMLTRMPLLGRTFSCDTPHVRRFHEGRHVIFYLSKPDEIWIGRVLHENMLPQRRPLFRDTDTFSEE